MGASLITIPWAFSNAGLVSGTAIILGTFLVSFYTTWLVITIHKPHEDDFTQTLERIFGKWGSYSNIVSSVLVLSVPILYFF